MMNQLLINEFPKFIPMNIVINMYYINIIDTITYEKLNIYLNFFDIEIINIERYLNMIDCIKVLDVIILDLRYKELSQGSTHEFLDNQEYKDAAEILIINLSLYMVIELIAYIFF